jgi:hypothetical protein
MVFLLCFGELEYECSSLVQCLPMVKHVLHVDPTIKKEHFTFLRLPSRTS